MKDKVYCINEDCPFTDCDKHLIQLSDVNSDDKYVTVANLDSVCRKYIGYLVNKQWDEMKIY